VENHGQLLIDEVMIIESQHIHRLIKKNTFYRSVTF